MALAGPQSNRPFLPAIPRQLPKTQAEWEQVANAFLDWQVAMSPVWITPTLENGWVNYGLEYEPAGYYIDTAGVVHLRGLVKGGTAGNTTPIFTLPAGYLPPYTGIYPTVSAGLFTLIHITNATSTDFPSARGAVVVDSGANNTWVSLSGISFSTIP